MSVFDSTSFQLISKDQPVKGLKKLKWLEYKGMKDDKIQILNLTT